MLRLTKLVKELSDPPLDMLRWVCSDAGLPVDAAESKLVVLATRLIGLDLGVKKQS